MINTPYSLIINSKQQLKSIQANFKGLQPAKLAKELMTELKQNDLVWPQVKAAQRLAKIEKSSGKSSFGGKLRAFLKSKKYLGTDARVRARELLQQVGR